MHLTTAQMDRAVGAVLGMATGDALGMGYEFGPAVPTESVVLKRNPHLPLFEPGEWTDDTTMAVPILEALAAGKDLLDPTTLDYVVGRWFDWLDDGPKDIGVSVSFVLGEACSRTAAGSAEAARDRYQSGALSGGNGSLMRTTPVVLGYLDDPTSLTLAARTYSDLTHADPDAADACALWNHAQRHAILHGDLDVTVGLEQIPAQRRGRWRRLLTEASQGEPADFAGDNGWVVAALQCAWAAISSTPRSGPEHFGLAVRAAVAAGHDTDTVAAIAGGLLGSRWGVSAIPLDWRRRLFGWPGVTGQDLVRATAAAASGSPWPDRFYAHLGRSRDPVVLPHDEGVFIGDVTGLRRLPHEVDAVVSLCRIGRLESPRYVKPENHVQVWLNDSAKIEENLNLDLVVAQTLEQIETLRAEGRTVYLHCVQGLSRTPFIAAAYGARVTGRSSAQVLDEVLSVLPGADPNPRFRAFLAGDSVPGRGSTGS